MKILIFNFKFNPICFYFYLLLNYRLSVLRFSDIVNLELIYREAFMFILVHFRIFIFVHACARVYVCVCKFTYVYIYVYIRMEVCVIAYLSHE